MSDFIFDTMVELIDRGSGSMRLVRTDSVDDVQEVDLSFLKELYNSKDKTKVIYASVLKSAILQKRVCFLLSRNELHKLVRADSDNRYKSVNEKDYTRFLIHILGNDILQHAFPPNDYEGIANLVVFHSRICKCFFQLETSAFYEDQFEKSKELYLKKLEKTKKRIAKDLESKPSIKEQVQKSRNEYTDI
jgi:hypothetical protein